MNLKSRETNIDDPQFWRPRLRRALAQNEIHRSVYDVNQGAWDNIQATHRELLAKLIPPGTRLLDAGCGYGALCEVLPQAEYVGIDLSPDFIQEARKRNPGKAFDVADLRKLPFPDRSFDMCIARSLDGMVKDRLGTATWRLMETELLRVADRLLLLSYTVPTCYRMIDAVHDAEDFTHNTIVQDGVTLIYRAGHDGTVEFYELATSDEVRGRGGLAAMNGSINILQKVIGSTVGTCYGFMRGDNKPMQKIYQWLGFSLVPLPGFYRGTDAVMAYKQCHPTTVGELRGVADVHT
ncbi:MAG: class I SAM-dependent methyltransferase [Opitutaceae bacterium]